MSDLLVALHPTARVAADVPTWGGIGPAEVEARYWAADRLGIKWGAR